MTSHELIDFDQYLIEYQVESQPNQTSLTFSDQILLVLKGCALGDYAGQPYEGWFLSDCQFLTEESLYQSSRGCMDDTILTCATANIFHDLQGKSLPEKENYENIYRSYAKEYPSILGGYGSLFLDWVYEGRESNSCGNGSAMRVSPCGCFDEQNQVITQAYQSAICTHSHPEGIKGAIVTAMCIWMAFHGASKKEIGAYTAKHYKKNPYSPELPFRKLQKYKTVQGNPFICQMTVPLAVSCFINSTSFEDCITKALQFGFDTDTQAAIAGSIAAAYYQDFDQRSEEVWNQIVKDSPYLRKEIQYYHGGLR